MIGMGFLVKSSPNLIAGYNTMSEDKKKHVDIEGLSTFMRNSFIIIGLSIIAGYYVFKWIGYTAIANSMILIATVIGVIIMLIHAQRFDHNKKNTKKTRLIYFILGLVIVLVIGLITYGYMPSKAKIINDHITFTGMYGFTMLVSEIDTIELSDAIPTIKMRTNGFSSGVVNKGFFNLDTLGKTRLLIHSDNAPFLIISKSNSDKIIINYKDKAKTEQVFEEIKTLISR
ncbi:MAG: DUF3784 domain-containing protein [Clostridia bacterium]|nr:DUF3784 domain-containing protein [Clostridia bacterium]